MDIESLLEIDDSNYTDTNKANKKSIFEQILDLILKENWNESSTEINPFTWNKNRLKSETAKHALIKILLWSELGTGKRWSFRDIFSLISYLLTGYISFSSKKLDIYKWLDDNTKKINSEDKKSYFKSLLEISSGLYHQKLFSINITKEELKNIKKLWTDLKKKKILKNISENSVIFCELLFKFITINNLSQAPSFLQNQLNNIDRLLTPTEYFDSQDTSCNDFYGHFSHTVQDGIEYLKNNGFFYKLHDCEQKILEILANIDEELGELKHKTIKSSEIQTIRYFIRKYACNTVRINLGVLTGTVKEQTFYQDYERIISNHRNQSLSDEDSDDIETYLEQLLNSKDSNHFSGLLNTSFGQTSAGKRLSAYIHSDKYSVEYIENYYDSNKSPKPIYPFFKVNLYNNEIITIPLTYELFKAIKLLQNNISESSLPRSVLANIDSCKALMLGASSRTTDRKRIKLIIGDYEISYRKNQFKEELNKHGE